MGPPCPPAWRGQRLCARRPIPNVRVCVLRRQDLVPVPALRRVVTLVEVPLPTPENTLCRRLEALLGYLRVAWRPNARRLISMRRRT